MGINTKIEWADHSFNPWLGCSRVKPGCDNCYAEAMMDTRLHARKRSSTHVTSIPSGVLVQGSRRATGAFSCTSPIADDKKGQLRKREPVCVDQHGLPDCSQLSVSF
jgi:protein gp37